jgi:hypothetical protein
MLAAAALLLAMMAPRDGLPPGAGVPKTGRCHMGECSWFAELNRETVREAAGGRLLRLSLIGGSSSSGEGEDYEASYGPQATVDWDRAAHDVWVFCSPRLPTVMTRSQGGRIQATVLNFVDWSPPVHESDRNVYVHACHGEAGEGFAERHGYRAPAEGEEEFELSRPEEIFERVR